MTDTPATRTADCQTCCGQEEERLGVGAADDALDGAVEWQTHLLYVLLTARPAGDRRRGTWVWGQQMMHQMWPSGCCGRASRIQSRPAARRAGLARPIGSSGPALPSRRRLQLTVQPAAAPHPSGGLPGKKDAPLNTSSAIHAIFHGRGQVHRSDCATNG